MYYIKKSTLLTAFFTLILGLSLSTAYAQDTENYQLTLKVVDAESGDALTNANIEILGIYEPHTTNNEGQVVFEEMATDPHTFKIYADGYETWIKTLTVTEDSRLTVELTPTG